jgi:hypothetical protein
MEDSQMIKWAALRAWLLRHWIPAQSNPELLDGDAMHAWLTQTDANNGIVYIGAIWSVTGLPQSFDIREVG